MRPSFTKLSANTAAVDAIRKSHIATRSQPAPIAEPFTAAIMGTSQAPR